MLGQGSALPILLFMNRLIEFEFNGRTLTAYCPAAAIYDIYEKFGTSDDIAEASHFLDPTRDGWDACCWILAEFCRWGELWRRQMGEDAQPMVSVSELQMAPPEDSVRFRELITQTISAGLRRDVPGKGEDGETDLVLQRIEAQKKSPPRGRFGLATLRRRPSSSGSRRKTP